MMADISYFVRLIRELLIAIDLCGFKIVNIDYKYMYIVYSIIHIIVTTFKTDYSLKRRLFDPIIIFAC